VSPTEPVQAGLTTLQQNRLVMSGNTITAAPHGHVVLQGKSAKLTLAAGSVLGVGIGADGPGSGSAKAAAFILVSGESRFEAGPGLLGRRSWFRPTRRPRRKGRVRDRP